jgi:hypothetical protein
LGCALYPYQFLWTFLAIGLHKLWHLWPTHFWHWWYRQYILWNTGIHW